MAGRFAFGRRRSLRYSLAVASLDRGERQQLAAGRPDLDFGAQVRADATVETRRPAAVVQLGLGQRVLPVLPEPFLVEAGVQVLPWQRLVLAAFAGGVPIEVHASLGQLGRGGIHPPLVGEILPPAIEVPALCPHATDDRTHSPVTTGQQP